MKTACPPQRSGGGSLQILPLPVEFTMRIQNLYALEQEITTLKLEDGQPKTRLVRRSAC